MVKRGELPEPSSAAHLAKLTPLTRLGGKMSKEACQNPEKAKYIGECCGGRRAWGELGADIYIDDTVKDKQWAVFCCGACKTPLPWLPLPPPPAAAPTAPVTLTVEQKKAIEEKRQAALARRKRAREVRGPIRTRSARSAELRAALRLRLSTTRRHPLCVGIAAVLGKVDHSHGTGF
jgi:hypothetical protein